MSEARFAVKPGGRHILANAMTSRTVLARIEKTTGPYLKAVTQNGAAIFVSARDGVGRDHDVMWHLVLEGETIEASLARGRRRLGTDAASRTSMNNQAMRQPGGRPTTSTFPPPALDPSESTPAAIDFQSARRNKQTRGSSK